MFWQLHRAVGSDSCLGGRLGCAGQCCGNVKLRHRSRLGELGNSLDVNEHTRYMVLISVIGASVSIYAATERDQQLKHQQAEQV